MKVLLFTILVLQAFCQIQKANDCMMKNCLLTQTGKDCKNDQTCNTALKSTINKFVTEVQNKNNTICFDKNEVEQLLPCINSVIDQDLTQNNENYKKFTECARTCFVKKTDEKIEQEKADQQKLKNQTKELKENEKIASSQQTQNETIKKDQNEQKQKNANILQGSLLLVCALILLSSFM